MINWIASFWNRLRRASGAGPGEEIDPDVREIFLAELDEVGAELGALLPAWRKQRGDAAILQQIRRGFHTVKGSGLVVGANTLAAYSARIEKLTLDMIERPTSATPVVVISIERAIAVLPECARALRAGRPMPAAVRAGEGGG